MTKKTAKEVNRIIREAANEIATSARTLKESHSLRGKFLDVEVIEEYNRLLKLAKDLNSLTVKTKNVVTIEQEEHE